MDVKTPEHFKIGIYCSAEEMAVVIAIIRVAKIMGEIISQARTNLKAPRQAIAELRSDTEVQTIVGITGSKDSSNHHFPFHEIGTAENLSLKRTRKDQHEP